MSNANKPMRRCVGCMQSFPKDTLVRITYHDGKLIADDGRQNDGRGMYLCRNRACLERVRKKKVFNRIMRCNLDADMIEELISSIADDLEEVVNGK